MEIHVKGVMDKLAKDKLAKEAAHDHVTESLSAEKKSET
jgi:hypothetical protein